MAHASPPGAVVPPATDARWLDHPVRYRDGEDDPENSLVNSSPEPRNDEHASWYVRRGSAVQGPYASRQIARYLLLGRIRQTDRVSVDGELWQGLAEVPHLIPDEMKDLESEEGRARFLAAHLRADHLHTRLDLGLPTGEDAVGEREDGSAVDLLASGERARAKLLRGG